MEAIEFKQVTEDDWKLVDDLESGSATPFFCPCDSEEGYRKYIRESTVYVIMKNGKDIGTVSHKTQDDGSILFNGLTILPEHRGQGVATDSMKRLLSNLGKQTYALLVHPENTTALMIYLRLGFVITEWKDNFFGDGTPRLYLKLVP
ncbi:GNAT family N-acetyltransferase [Candidatus Peregrinibacteria bacterium]|jgi:ribosomal protein S18 acetylase RimI-like enzyme|nr:GNAT family N-acetyltransferase [Candidatus Peregrinibacteria bacterium]